MLIQSISHRGLRRFLESGSARFLRPDLVERVDRVITVLRDAETFQEFIDLAPSGWRLHQISERRGNHWTVSVSGNWRITFEERDGVIYNLNLEDYH